MWYSVPDDGDGCWLKVFRLAGGDHFLVRYGDGTDFLIHRSGSKVWCRWREEFDFNYAATYLFGPVLGFLLRLRGVVCLHASVVDIQGQAVAFMGPAEAGKSTLAATFGKYGYSVLSDDILALRESGDEFEAVPAYPRLRLWPSSVSALFGSPDVLPRITASWDKRHLDLTAENFHFQTRHQPLGAVYILGERTDDYSLPRVQALTGMNAWNSLTANSYAYKLFDKEMRAYEFALLSRLASRIPVRRIVPFADLTRIEQLYHLVLDDFQSLTRLASPSHV